MPRRLFLSLLSVLLIGSCFAQTKKIDSLRAVLAAHPQADTFRLNRLNELVTSSILIDLPAAQSDSLATQALSLAKRLNYIDGQAVALGNLADARLTNSAKPTISLYRQALSLAERSGNKPLLIDLLLRLALVYGFDQNDPGKQALPYIQRAIALAKITQQPALLIKAYSLQAMYGTIVSDLVLSLQAQFQALVISQNAHLLNQEVEALYRIGSTYEDLADYDQALLYSKQAVQKVRASPRKHDPALVENENYALVTIGNCYRLTAQYDQAISIYQLALKGLKNPYMIIDAKWGLADVYER